MTDEKEEKTTPESETKSKKTKRPDESCNWTFHNYDDHYGTNCGMQLYIRHVKTNDENFKTCPGCGKKIKLI